MIALFTFYFPTRSFIPLSLCHRECYKALPACIMLVKCGGYCTACIEICQYFFPRCVVVCFAYIDKIDCRLCYQMTYVATTMSEGVNHSHRGTLYSWTAVMHTSSFLSLHLTSQQKQGSKSSASLSSKINVNMIFVVDIYHKPAITRLQIQILIIVQLRHIDLYLLKVSISKRDVSNPYPVAPEAWYQPTPDQHP